ncbi:GroES-like protein [Whalleya microplaca]|nr:GroES-like protein [Whalleya microplaca]
MAASNLSLILDSPKVLRYEERPIPSLKSPHDVLVAVNYTGICGSDIHLWEDGGVGSLLKDPIVLGHESAGTVVQIGSKVKGLLVGDHVAIEPGTPCRRCEDCLDGHYNLCPDMVFAACPPHHGTLTGFWVAPHDFCYKLPPGVSLKEGALIEPLAVAVHIVRQAAVTPGQSVVIMGAGPVGLLCAAVARVFGASKIVSVDIIDSKLEFAKSFSSTHVYKSQQISPEENASAIKKVAGLPRGADAVIDASGFELSIRTSLSVVRAGGTYVQGGMGKSDIIFPIMELCIKQVTAKGSFRYSSGDYRLAIDLVGTGRINVRDLITDTVPFQQAEEAYQRVKGGQAIKILISGPNENI